MRIGLREGCGSGRFGPRDTRDEAGYQRLFDTLAGASTFTGLGTAPVCASVTPFERANSPSELLFREMCNESSERFVAAVG